MSRSPSPRLRLRCCLKVGDLKSDDRTITADNSLVQRLKIDRHTGAIQYEN